MREALIALSVGMSALFGAPASFASSRLDAEFKFQRQNSERGPVAHDLADLYRDVLAKSMSTECHWFPSDSQYLRLMSRRCGSFRGSVLAISRFMSEPDAHLLSRDIINVDDHIRFVDFGESCEIF